MLRSGHACSVAFGEPMDDAARDSENAEGLYCSDLCAKHAGGRLEVAQAEHWDAGG